MLVVGYTGNLNFVNSHMQLYECIIVSKEIDNKFILAKNRDRAYKPKLEVVHEILDGVEVVYLHDITTDWSEGMNEFGIGLVNSALMVGHDEAEKKIVKKSGKPSKDGKTIRKVLTQKTLKSAVKMVLGYNGYNNGIKGHTFISSPKYMVSVEQTSKHKPNVILQNIEHPIVRTNHGHIFTDAGYIDGINYKSSKIRKISAEKTVDKIKNWRDIPIVMRKQFYKSDSQLNMRRDTDKMFTSSQTLMNLTDRIFHLEYFESKVESFDGIRRNLPIGYVPKIKIEIKRIENI
jgi:hypothetical protein